MTSAIDPSVPIGPVAYTADVRANFAAAKAEIEALQAMLAGYSVDDSGNVAITAASINIMATNANGSGLGAWLFSADTIDAKGSVGVGIGSGNADGSGGWTGTAWLYSGNVTSGPGNSGMVYVESGDVTDGIGGDIVLVTGQVIEGGTGTRGNIMLDAPSIRHTSNSATAVFGSRSAPYANYAIWVPDGQELDLFASGDSNCAAWIWTDDNDGTVGDGGTGFVGIGSGQIKGGNGTTGAAWLYSGNVLAGSGNTGNVWIYSGDIVDGRSGDVVIGSGYIRGAGARGNLVLDAPMITTVDGLLLYLSPAPGQDVGIESQDTQATGGNSGGVWIGTSGAAAAAGDLSFYAGASFGANTNGGRITISAGDARTGNANGGNIEIGVGRGVGTGQQGNIIWINPRTTDPHVPGALWCDPAAGRALKVSAG